MTEFSETIRYQIFSILKQKYNTVRHGGHAGDVDEFRRRRPFWPDMQFHDVKLEEGPNGDQVRITFTPVDEPTQTFGFKVDVEDAAATWRHRVGIRDPHKHSNMFAAEIIWYMIAYIGVSKFEECPDKGDGVRWINSGDDVFKPLPDPLAFQKTAG